MRTLRLDSVVIAMVLVACSRPKPWPPAGAGDVSLIDDLVVRREMDGVVSVMATVTLDGVSSSGFVRLPRHAFETAAASAPVSIARARAWQTLGKLLAGKPERAYEAARSGALAVANCVMFDASFTRRRAELTRDEPGGLSEAVARMQGLLDTSIISCARRYRGWAL